MQKKINIEVRKLVKNKNIQNAKENILASLPNAQSRTSLKKRIIIPEKGVTFQQLYFQMKKNKQNCFISSNGSTSTISYKTSDKSFVTPQNRSHMTIDQGQSENIHKSLDKINVQKKKIDNYQQVQERKTLKRIIRKKQNSNHEKSLQKKKSLNIQTQKSALVQTESSITNLSKLKNTQNIKNQALKQQKPDIKIRQNLRIYSLKSQFQNIFTSLDHTMHTHLRQVQCFLQFNEFIHVLRLLQFTSFKNMQKDININAVDYSPLKPDFYQECQFYTYIIKMWKQLGGQTYGGVVKDNLLSFLMIIVGQYKSIQFDSNGNNYQRSIKNSYINNNLKLTVNSQQIQDIFAYYFPLRMRRQSQLKNNSNSLKMIQQSQSKKKHQVYQVFPQTEDFIKIQNSENTSSTLYNAKNSISQKYNQKEQFSELLKQKMSQFSPKLIPQCRLSQTQTQIQALQNRHYLTPQNSKQLYSSQIPTMIQTQSRQFIVQSRKPLLSVDVNLGEGKNEKLIVFECENAHQVSLRLKQKYKISEQLRQRFQKMLDQHIRNLLFKIQEVSQQLFSDHQGQNSQIKSLKS